MFKTFLWLLIFSAETIHSIFENCDFYQKMDSHKSYTIFSPGFPQKYTSGVTCRWYAESNANTRIRLTCDDFDIPPSMQCWQQTFAVSRQGRIDLNDVEYYCGRGRVEITSTGNSLNVLLLTKKGFYPGGSFLCRLVAEEIVFPPNLERCVCGYKNSMRIVGGSETGVNEYPMMAGLIDGVRKELFCGGTIISFKHVLTAAHCLVNKQSRNVAVLVGDHDLSTGGETDSAKLYLTFAFAVHPGYSAVTQRDDIAVVQVRDRMAFGMKVGPVCLPFANARDKAEGLTVVALGWGSVSFGGPSSNKLLKVSLEVTNLQDCKTVYGKLISDKQICTYKEDKDACQSDSGGPLLWSDPASGSLKILGIISYGIQCATTNPSVNTKVTSYLDWIKSTTGENFCVK